MKYLVLSLLLFAQSSFADMGTELRASLARYLECKDDACFASVGDRVIPLSLQWIKQRRATLRSSIAPRRGQMVVSLYESQEKLEDYDIDDAKRELKGCPSGFFNHKPNACYVEKQKNLISIMEDIAVHTEDSIRLEVQKSHSF
jgi:hypothetical protein